jgi:CDP-6-deoxy-D-xylo-4-hexulose-3-dehydrase
MTTKPDWYFPTAFSCWSREEDEAIARVIRSGHFTMGAEVEAFEREFADWHGKKHAIMVNSGSSANLVAVAAMFADAPPQSSRDFVVPHAIVPAIAWSTTYAPVVQHGFELLPADCDATWNAYIPTTIPKPTHVRLVVVCSILGNPGYLREWCDVARGLGAYVLEDNCESFGAIPPESGKHCGAFGDLSTFSFFYSHQISAIEGGMVLTDDDDLARLCRMLRAHGWSRDVEPPRRFEDEYDFRVMGYNVRPLEMHAAVAREQLKKSVGFQTARQANAHHFRRLTEGLQIEHQSWRGIPSSFGLPFLCETPEVRSKLVGALRAAGIDCRLPTGGSLGLHRYGARWSHHATPTADIVHTHGLFLGNAPFDISEKIERAAKVIKGALA